MLLQIREYIPSKTKKLNFYNQQKILYPLRGIQPNLNNKKYNHIHSCSIEQIKKSHTFIPKGMDE